jgi:hypothetical protein
LNRRKIRRLKEKEQPQPEYHPGLQRRLKHRPSDPISNVLLPNSSGRRQLGTDGDDDDLLPRGPTEEEVLQRYKRTLSIVVPHIPVIDLGTPLPGDIYKSVDTCRSCDGSTSCSYKFQCQYAGT